MWNTLHRQALLGRRYAAAWGVLLVSLLLTGLAWYGLRQQAADSDTVRFDLRAREVVEAIEARMRQHEQILLGGAGLFDAQGGRVGRAAWRTYVARLNLARNYPGIQGVGFTQLLEPAELAAHVAAVRAEGFADYTVRPPGERRQYTSIIYLEPFNERNQAAFGYDMLSEPTRAQAMRRAGESGETSISGRVKLVQEIKGRVQAGFLMYVPVYDRSLSLGSAEQRWRALRGFVYSPYRMGDLMAGILGERRGDLDFALYDGTEETPEALMYDSAEEEGRDAEAAALTRRHTLQVHGRTWSVRLDSRPGFADGSASGLALAVLLLGLSISALLFALTVSLIARRARAEELAVEMTAEIRASQDRLRLSEARLNEAQRTAMVGSWELDVASGALVWTDEVFRLFELDRARSVPTFDGFLNVIHPDDREAVQRAYADSLATREPYEIAHRLLMGDGRVKWVHERCATDFDADGRPLRSRGTVQDITRLTEAQRTAQETAQQLRAILDNVVDGIITIDENGLIQSFNRAASAIFGHAPEEVLGRNVSLLMPEPHRSRHDGYLRAYRETGVRHIIGNGREVEGLHKDGRTIPLDLAVSQSMHAGRALYIGLVRDITERKRIEKMKSEFVSTVSHELRTPLTSIRGALGLISGGAVGAIPEQAMAMLRIASNNTERLLLLINDILDMQKIESGQMAFRFHNLTLLPFLRQVLHDLAAYGEQHGVHFVITRADETAQVYADKDRLAQVMANLLSNAAKFSPRGAAVEVAVQSRPECIRIAVTDHGPGIAENFRARLFERFTQSDSSDSRSKGGTGLGLAIAKAIVEKHGGQIGFVTELGRGTTFHVDLPPLAGGGAELARLTSAAAPATGVRALVVEDDPDVAALVQRMLADAGCRADVARDAAQARALLAQQPQGYGFMTLDLVLPGEDGLSFLRSLRADAATRALPVVVLSVRAGEARHELSGGAVGVVDWLSKPIDQGRLAAVVRQVVRPGQLPRVLHVEDDADIRQVVQAMLGDQCELASARTVQAARELLERQSFDLVLLDIGLPDGSGLDLLEVIERRMQPPRVVIFSAQEVPAHFADKVSAALVKSGSDNERLRQVLLGVMHFG